jgi:hypothetical protein
MEDLCKLKEETIVNKSREIELLDKQNLDLNRGIESWEI